MSLKPWEIHPSLTDSRLRVIGRIVRDARRRAVETVFDPRQGDTAWGLGCVVYERTCFAIALAARTEPLHAWLSVIESDGLKFSFAVGGVPLRFYRGDVERTPPNRTLHIRAPELEAQQLCFLDEDNGGDFICRLIVEVDEAGLVSRVAFARASQAGELRDVWIIPEDGEAVVLPFDSSVPPVDVEPPVVRPAVVERAELLGEQEKA